MRSTLTVALTLALLTTPALAHGGQYKGPSDAGGGSSAGGGQAAPPTNPGGAAAPGPGAPASGAAPTGPTSPGGRGKGNGQNSTGGPVIDDSTNYEIWEFWWENNKDQYLNLKNRLTHVTSQSGSSTVLTGKGRADQARSSRRASSQQIVNEVIPTLIGLLKTATNRDILDSDVLALGRTAGEEQADPVLTAAQPLLGHKELSVQTSATLSLGVLNSPKAIPLLAELMSNTSRGQQLAGGGDVPWLSRAFAALSLGLINDPNSVDQLISIVKNTPDADRDLKVCAIVALGLMDNNKVSDAYDFLLTELTDRKLDSVIKSYIPTTLGKMAGGTKVEAVPSILKVFTDKDTDNYVRQSCAISLGLLARVQDADVLKALHQYISEGKDTQTRHFCFIALAEIGKRDKDGEVEHADQHEALRDLFTREASKPSTKTNRSWAALAGAIYAKDIPSAAPAMIETLQKAYEKETDPSFKAAFAIGLGLLNASSMGPKIHQDFKESKEEDFRGYAAVSLGFMQYTQGAEDLRELCKSKTIGPTFRLQVATGLGLMGDTEAVSVLIDTLRDSQTLGVSSAVAKALGLIGDQAAIGPLKDLANDDKVQPITRAFACVALGIVCEKTELPWNARISADNNYRANVPAIGEVLDIL
jgi:HEAT repeat protein